MRRSKTPEELAALASFGRWFDAEARRLGLTNRQVADALGLDNEHVTIGRWRRGMSEPTPANLMGIARLLKMPIQTIMYELGYEIDESGQTLALPPNLVPVPVLRRVTSMQPTDWEREADYRTYAIPRRALRPKDHFVGIELADDHALLRPYLEPGDLLICDPSEPVRGGRLCVDVDADGAPHPRWAEQRGDHWYLTDGQEVVPHNRSRVLGVVVEIRRTPPGI